MSRLTIVIPFFPETPIEAFEETLASVLMFRPEETEILIANVAGYDNPWNVEEEGVHFLTVFPSQESASVLNRVVEQSRSPIIHILYPGAEVSENWAESSVGLFADADVGIVSPAIYDRKKSRRVFSYGTNFGLGGRLRTIRRSQLDQSALGNIAPHVGALFFRKSLWHHVGGFDTTMLLQLAYVDFAFRARSLGKQTVLDQATKITVRPHLLPSIPPYRWGKQIERLYYRWLYPGRSITALGSHLEAIISDFWRHAPKMKAFQALGGRLTGMVTSAFQENKFELPSHDEACDAVLISINSLDVKKRCSA